MTTEASLPLAGRTALITGAASGIGAATARRLAADGARVALLARRADRLDALAAELGDDAIAVTADVTDPATIAAALERVHEAFGPVDLVVANAGLMLVAPVTAGHADEWRRMVEVNVLGLLEVVRVALPDLLQAAAADRSADVVHVSSTSAEVRLPGTAVYGATKAAVSYLSAALRDELTPEGVRVCDVKPSATTTELATQTTHAPSREAMQQMFGSLELLQAADIADAIAYIVSRPNRVNLTEVSIWPIAQPS